MRSLLFVLLISICPTLRANELYRYTSHGWQPLVSADPHSPATLVIHGQNVESQETLGLHLNSLKTTDELALALFKAGHQVVGYNYDFTKPFTTVSGDLSEKIIKAHLNIDEIYAHSMGGIVARHLVEYRGFRPDKLVMFGSPHLGIPIAEEIELLLSAGVLLTGYLYPDLQPVVRYFMSSTSLFANSLEMEDLNGYRKDPRLQTQYMIVQGDGSASFDPVHLLFDSLIYGPDEKDNDGICQVYSESDLINAIPAQNIKFIYVDFDHTTMISTQGIKSISALLELSKHSVPAE